MKNLIYLFLLFACLPSLQAQNYDPSKVNKKAFGFYNQAMEKAQEGNMDDAAQLLIKAIETDGSYLDAYLSLAGVYGQKKQYSASTDYYEKAFVMDPEYTFEYKLPYSINLAGQGEFEKALIAINELLDKNPPKNSNTLKAAEYRKRCYEFALQYAKKNAGKEYVFTPMNMGDAINSAESEYFPSLTIDGQEFIFTRRLNGANEDFFTSARTGNNWSAASPLAGNVNTPQNEAAQNISQDGEWLVFTGCYRPDGFGSCDIYISYKQENGWSEPINLGDWINSDQWESQPCLSPDKRELYFASRRHGGFGGSDIYVSRIQPNGKWSEPENMGDGVNTAGDEQSPFMHADNQTLYFTSNHWPGYGDDDLFYIRKGPGGTWSKPINLGYPINTINREGTLFIAADGKTAYYASDRSDSRGGMDIYSFELREDVRPYKTAWVKGRVFDKKTGKGLPSAVELIDIKGKQTISKVQTDEQGLYMITLPQGKDYAFNVNRRGYLFYSENISLQKNSGDSVYEKNIALQPIEADASVVLNNVFFDVNKWDIRPESQLELDKVVQLMKENPTVIMQISGHTDNAGKPSENLILSNNRARAVVSYLVQHGIDPKRLSAKGFGETKPVAGNETEEGRARNRRTEMKVLSTGSQQ